MSNDEPPGDGEFHVFLPDGREVGARLPDGRDVQEYAAALATVLVTLWREPPTAMVNLVAIANHAAAGLLALAPEEARRELSATERAELADDLRRDLERIVAWLVP